MSKLFCFTWVHTNCGPAPTPGCKLRIFSSTARRVPSAWNSSIGRTGSNSMLTFCKCLMTRSETKTSSKKLTYWYWTDQPEELLALRPARETGSLARQLAAGRGQHSVRVTVERLDAVAEDLQRRGDALRQHRVARVERNSCRFGKKKIKVSTVVQP